MFYTNLDAILDNIRNDDYFYINDVKYLSKFPYNQYEDKEGNVYFEFALAGIPKEFIDITKSKGIVSVSLKGKEKKENVKYEHKEIEFPTDKETVIASIELDSDYDEPKASYENGLLTLKFEVKAEEKPKKIEF